MPLEIANVAKRYGNRWVLRDVDFTAFEGQVLGILGAVGSGKSSLLRVIAGLAKPVTGSVTFDGREIGAVAYIGEAGPAGFSAIFRGPNKTSLGERQKVKFQAAIAGHEKVLLLDDPFCKMDASMREECFAQLKNKIGRKAVVFATCDFLQLARIADKVAVLDGTYIVEMGYPSYVYDHPQTVAAATLTGEVNLIEARRLTSTNVGMPEFQTVAGGHRVFTRPVEKSRLGAINKSATLGIRPEQVSMSMGASFPEDNLVRGVVTAIRPCGPTCLIDFDASGLRLTTRVFKVVGLAIGDECMLGLPPDRIVVLN